MPIPPFIVERIRTASLSGQQVADSLAKLAKVVDATGGDECAVSLEFTQESDQLAAGDLIPIITLALVRHDGVPTAAEAATDVTPE